MWSEFEMSIKIFWAEFTPAYAETITGLKWVRHLQLQTKKKVVLSQNWNNVKQNNKSCDRKKHKFSITKIESINQLINPNLTNFFES